MRSIVCWLAMGVLASGIGSNAMAQDAAVRSADPTRGAPLPGESSGLGRTYDALQAGRDAYEAAEQDRRAAIDRQLQLQNDIRWYNTWLPPYGYYQPTLPNAYRYGGTVYGSPWTMRRAYRNGYGAYVPAWPGWPRLPGDVYGNPSYGNVRQPTGHEKMWTSPNGYIYRPRYDESPEGRRVPPVPPPPAPAPPQPPESPSAPVGPGDGPAGPREL